MEKPYSVEIWGSDPDLDNDDCWTGRDFASLEDARAVFEAMKGGNFTIGGHFNPADAEGTGCIVLARRWVDSSACLCSQRPVYQSACDHIVAEHIEKGDNPLHKPDRHINDDEWRSEMRMQAGMGFGVQGYNDFEGY